MKKRVVLGEGHPWFFVGPHGADLRLYKEPLAESILFRKHDPKNVQMINPAGLGNWNRIRLVAEILPVQRKKK